MDIYKILAVGGGGFLGSISRYLTVKFIDSRIATVLPYGTLLVNIVGSFLLGLLYGAALRYTGVTENWRLFLGAGFCGGFTTFSAFAFENVNLIQQKDYGISFTYIIVSVVIGLGALAAGIWGSRFI
ncbi:MAG: fluoride efflux transporter CrcB [Chryseolinea sp.]